MDFLLDIYGLNCTTIYHIVRRNCLLPFPIYFVKLTDYHWLVLQVSLNNIVLFLTYVLNCSDPSDES